MEIKEGDIVRGKWFLGDRTFTGKVLDVGKRLVLTLTEQGTHATLLKETTKKLGA